MKSEQEWEIELREVLEKLRNNSINELDLSDHKLDTNGAKVLAGAFKENCSLKILYLSNNDIRNEGAAALAEALKVNRSLTTIFLGHNNIGDVGANALANTLKINHSLATINLWRNNINAEGAIALAGVLKENYSLTILDLSINKIEDEQKRVIEKYLERNINLRDQLHKVVQTGDLKKTQECIQVGAGLLSVTGKEKNTPLHWAAANGHIDIVRLLVAKMAEEKLNFEVKNGDNNTPLDLAKKNGHEKIVQLLQEAKEKVVQDNNVVSQQLTIEKSVKNYLQKGGRSFVNEDYSESLQYYESALKLQPENVEALVYKGKVLQKLNQFEEAKQAYQQAIAIEDKSAEKYYQQAKKQLRKIEKKQILLQQQSIPTTVSTSIGIPTSTSEKDIREYLQKGNQSFVDEDYAESLQCYESALKSQPEHVEALVLKGKVLGKLNQIEGAKQAYQQAIAIEDKSAEKYHQQAKRQLEKIKSVQTLQEWEIELQDVLEKMRNNSINEINLRHYKLDANGAKVLAKALKGNHSLLAIYLNFNYIGNEGANALAKALKENHSLTKLDLCNNWINKKGASVLAEALKENRSLTEVNLSSNKISAEGAVAIAGALKINNALTAMILGWSDIGDEGAVALAEAFKVNCSLTEVSLFGNDIGAKGVAALAEALKVNHSLTEVDLLGSNISAEQEKIIKTYLDRNIALRDQLHQVVQAGNLEKTQEYIQCGVGLFSVTGEEENAPLHWAAAKGHIDIVKLLLEKMVEKKFNLAIKNKDNQTPLDLAKKNGHKEVIQLLQINNALKDISSGETERYIQRGEKFLADEEYSEALLYFEEVLKLQPEHTEVLFRKGTVLRKLSRLEKAKNVFQSIIAIEDKNAEKYQQLAKKHLQEIEKEQAFLQQQSVLTVVSQPTESITSEREELLGRVNSKAEFRRPNIQQTSATKQTKTINSSATIPLSRNPERLQFSARTTPPQTNASQQNNNDSNQVLHGGTNL